ncbi:MAG: diguanylate cyclase [Myxococcaceae bacterium]
MVRTSESSGRERPLLLVVEDETVSREPLCELLRGRFDVAEAEDGEQALLLSRKLEPDLILLDVFLPIRDGITAHGQLAQDPKTRDIPVIFMSGEREDMPSRCLEMGGADFIGKPFEPRELMARVERALRIRWEHALLAEHAQTDALTGLSNFRAFQVRIDLEHKRAVRYDYPLSLVVIDVDHLKSLNDRFGHATGNKAICTVAQKLRENLRETDYAARYGGDEFVVLLPHQNPYVARIFVERLRQSLASMRFEGAPDTFVTLTISCGVAGHFTASPKEDPKQLFEAADEALYEAKRAGRNRAVVFEEGRRHREGQRLA